MYMRTAMFGGALAVALIPLATTCGKESITGPVGGEVVELLEIGGEPLPVAIQEAPGYVRTWLADTIHLGENGRWSRIQRHDFQTPSETREVVWESEGTIEEFEGEIILHFVCNDMGLCVAPDRLIPDVGGYRMEKPVAAGSVIAFRYYDIGLGGGE
jgi:hypothetical protein